MPESGRARTLIAVLALVALVVLTVDFRQGRDGPLAAVQRGAWTVFAPVTEGFATVVRPVGEFIGAIGEVGRLRERNAALSEEVSELRRSEPAVQDLLRENEDLRSLLDMRARLDLETVGARVIGQPPGQVAFSVVIDAGADAGLRPGMAVIDDDGLVGKLTEVVARHAIVELLSSPDARYAVRVSPSGRTGLMQGLGSRPFRLEIRDPSVRVEPGNEVVTRTFQGSTIPEGIPVGVVAEADEQSSPRYRSVRPYSDLANLSLVQVVVNGPVQPEELPDGGGVERPDGVRPAPPDNGGDVRGDTDAEGDSDPDGGDAEGGGRDGDADPGSGGGEDPADGDGLGTPT